MPLGDEDYVKTLQAEIDRQKKDADALRQELSATGGVEVEKPSQAVKTALIPNVPTYIANINDLALAADSEAVRLQANKLLIEWAVTEKLINTDDATTEEFKQLLKNLQKKKKSSGPSTT